jgi:hypothetical protein
VVTKGEADIDTEVAAVFALQLVKETLQKAPVKGGGMMRIGGALVRHGWGNEAVDIGNSGV